MKKGFTLVEVLLAVAVLSLGLTILLASASQCMAVMRQAREFQTAQWTLGLGEAKYPPAVSDNMEKDLVVDPVEVNGQTFSREVQKENERDEKDKLLVVKTIVTWASRGRDMREEVVRYVLDTKE